MELVCNTELLSFKAKCPIKKDRQKLQKRAGNSEEKTHALDCVGDDRNTVRRRPMFFRSWVGQLPAWSTAGRECLCDLIPEELERNKSYSRFSLIQLPSD